MSTRGYLVIEGEDEGRDAAYVYIDGDAYPDQVETAVSRFLQAHTNGDLYGMNAQEKAEALVKAVEDRRKTEFPKTFSFGRVVGSVLAVDPKVTTIEYSPWLRVAKVRPTAATLQELPVFTLTHGYDLFAGTRLYPTSGR